MHSATLQSATPDPEAFMAYVARVSNPANQDNPDHGGLLRYCLKKRHWSVFEHAVMTLEVTTTLDVATQLLRHRSFTFAQLSRRYASGEQARVSFEMPELRTQHPTNRQASLDTLPEEQREEFEDRIAYLYSRIEDLYDDMIVAGVAKECARAVLPQSTETRLYVTGNCRSWITYIALRSGNGTQPEHQRVALSCREAFRQVFPVCAEALDAMAWAI